MGETVGAPEGCISVGPWGGTDGEPWCYVARGGLKQILLRHGHVIDSIAFQSQTGDGSPEYSNKFGGTLGDRTDKVFIDSPAEYLTNIYISYGVFAGPGLAPSVTISSLRFKTNLAEYGPFGANKAGAVSTSSIPIEDGDIVGFHGRAGKYLNSIGLYLKPRSSKSRPSPIHDWESIQHQIMKLVVPRDPGPWGGEVGKQWDDGVYSAVTQVRVYLASDENVIRSVEFQYQRADGEVVWSARHGAPGGRGPVKRIYVDGSDEMLVGVEGYYGPVESKSGIEAITSLSFYTNKGLYGPYGEEIGKSFTSALCGGKVVGFFGRSSCYLNAIGIHMEYP